MLWVLVALFIFGFGSADAQHPSAASQSVSTDIHVSDGPGAAFQFSKIDDNLRAEADALDAHYEESGLVFHDPGLQAYIDSVGHHLLDHRPIPEKVVYRFLVLREPAANAFALPNGSVYITTGLVALLENEAQLAGVLGHETAHVYERHPYFESRSIRKKTVAAEIISLAARCASGGYATVLATAAAANVSTLILVESVYGYSREMENQADHDGLISMTVAGYDPHAMVGVFELLDKDRTLEYQPNRTFFHDHPSLVQRRHEALVFADSHTRPNVHPASEMDHLTATASAVVFDVSAELESRRPRTAVSLARRLANASPSNAQYQLLLGESYRALGAKTAVPTDDELTPEGISRQRKRMLKMTEQEEQEALLKTAEGMAVLKENQAMAERALQSAIEIDPKYALAYRERGFLYQDESRYADAATEYKHYLQLVADTSLDRRRIERRLSEIEKLRAAPAR